MRQLRGDIRHRTRVDARASSAHRLSGVPAWTHLAVAIAFPAWLIGMSAHLYGIETQYRWWQGFGDLMSVLVVGVLLVALPPSVALESWAITRARPWTARTSVVGYALVAGFISFVPTGLRFAGDTSPTPVDLLTLSLASYAVLIGAQVLATCFVCRLLRRKPIVQPHPDPPSRGSGPRRGSSVHGRAVDQ